MMKKITLEEYLKQKGYTLNSLAHKTGISHTTLYCRTKIKDMKFENVYLISKELNVTCEYLYENVE